MEQNMPRRQRYAASSNDNLKTNKVASKRTEKKAKSRKQKKIEKILMYVGIGLVAVQLICSAVFCYLVIDSDMLPAKYFIMISAILIVLYIAFFLMQLKKIPGIVGKSLSVILSVVLIFVCYNFNEGMKVLAEITARYTKVDVVNLYVLTENEAQTIYDAADYSFGILHTLDRENTDIVLDTIQTDLNKEIIPTEYDSITSALDAFYAEEIDVLIINHAYVELITNTEGFDDFKDFETRARVLSTQKIESEAPVEENPQNTPVSDITNTPFAVYLSGIDTYGSISNTSRSDVNIIAAVNPATKQVFLVSTPRDYYVPLSRSNGVKDKLTHAGIYGVNESIKTLEMLYDVDINYHFRVNFSGFQQIINALGGIDVEIDYSFKSSFDGSWFTKGNNHLNGTRAMYFVRERYRLPNGDRQRGEHQMMVIEAIIDKAQSPAVLSGYSQLIKSVQEYFQTSFTMDEVAALVKMQLSDNASWNVVTYSVNGQGKTSTTYSLNQSLYVMEPDMNTVNHAKEMIDKVFAGETISAE